MNHARSVYLGDNGFDGGNFSISTIRPIIKNFQSTENFVNLPGRGHVSISSKCMVRRRVWEAKDSSKITAGELQKKVVFQGQGIIKQHLHHHMLFGRASRKTYPSPYAKSTNGSHLSQSHPVSATNFCSMFFRVWLNLSTRPSVCGW